MIVRKKYPARWLLLPTAALFAVTPFAWSQDEAAAETAPAEPAEASTEVMESMGHAMAQSLRLNVGFSADELDALFAGMRAFAEDQELNHDPNDSTTAARDYYRTKVMAYMEAAKAMQMEANEAYFAGLEGVEETESGLRYEILEEGEGDPVEVGNQVVLNYTGKLIDGTVFDEGEGTPFALREAGGLIPGFIEGLKMLKVGSKARLHIPADLAYGERPPPGSPIEPNAALVFDVEVVSMNELPSAPPQIRSMPPRPNGPPPGAPPGPPPNITPPPPPTTPPPPPPPSARQNSGN